MVRDPTCGPSPPGHLTPLPSNIHATPPIPGGSSCDSPDSPGHHSSLCSQPSPYSTGPLGSGQTTPGPAEAPQLLCSGAPGFLQGARCEVGGGRADGVSGCVPVQWPWWTESPGQECDAEPEAVGEDLW